MFGYSPTIYAPEVPEDPWREALENAGYKVENDNAKPAVPAPPPQEGQCYYCHRVMSLDDDTMIIIQGMSGALRALCVPCHALVTKFHFPVP